MFRLILLIFLLGVSTAYAVTPSWVKQLPKEEFPADFYFCDIGISSKNYEEAKKRALSSLARQIELKVKAKSIQKIESDVWKNREIFDEYYSNQSMIYSAIDLKNAEIVKQQTDGKNFYVLAVIDKQKFVTSLRNDLKTINTKINFSIKSFSENFEKNRVNDAIQNLIDVNYLIWDAEETIKVLGHIVELNNNDTIAFDENQIENLLKDHLLELKIKKISGDNQKEFVGKKLEPFVIKLTDKKGNPIKKMAIDVDLGQEKNVKIYTNEDGLANYSVRVVDTKEKEKIVSFKVVFPFVQTVIREIEEDLAVDFKYKSKAVKKVGYKLEIISEFSKEDEKKIKENFDKELNLIGAEIVKKSDKKIKINIKTQKLADIVSMTRLVQQKVEKEIIVFENNKEKGKLTSSSVGMGNSDNDAIKSALLSSRIDLEELAEILGQQKNIPKISTIIVDKFAEKSSYSSEVGAEFALILKDAIENQQIYEVIEEQKVAEVKDDLKLSDLDVLEEEKFISIAKMLSSTYCVRGSIETKNDKIVIKTKLIKVNSQKLKKEFVIEIDSFKDLRYAGMITAEKLAK